MELHKQHTYVARNSVDSAIHSVAWTIEKTLYAKLQALGAFLDIEE